MPRWWAGTTPRYRRRRWSVEGRRLPGVGSQPLRRPSPARWSSGMSETKRGDRPTCRVLILWSGRRSSGRRPVRLRRHAGLSGTAGGGCRTVLVNLTRPRS
jgi:hypothetical protein